MECEKEDEIVSHGEISRRGGLGRRRRVVLWGVGMKVFHPVKRKKMHECIYSHEKCEWGSNEVSTIW